MDSLINNSNAKIRSRELYKKDGTLWTPEIQQSNLQIQYYNVKIKFIQQQIDSTARIDDITSRMTKEIKQSISNIAQPLSVT
jgi:hypothetical protein